MRKKIFWLGMFFLVLISTAVSQQQVRGRAVVHFIDVGQSDATLIVTNGGTMLIDAGSRASGQRVVQYIRNLV